MDLRRKEHNIVLACVCARVCVEHREPIASNNSPTAFGTRHNHARVLSPHLNRISSWAVKVFSAATFCWVSFSISNAVIAICSIYGVRTVAVVQSSPVMELVDSLSLCFPRCSLLYSYLCIHSISEQTSPCLYL